MFTEVIKKRTLSLSHLLVFLALLGSLACQKEMSKESPGSFPGGGSSGGSAVFSLVPAGAKCSDAVVTGSFVAGTALSTDALLTVTVNVTARWILSIWPAIIT